MSKILACDSKPQDCSRESLEERTLGIVKFDSLDDPFIPEEFGLKTYHKYILTDGFWTNLYINTLEDDATHFEIDAVYGEDLKVGREYMIVDPLF